MRHGAIDDLDHDIARFVVSIYTAVNEGNALIHAASEFEFEVRQTVVAHAATESNNRRLTNMCFVR